MFYIQQDNKILLVDEDKQRLQNTIAFMPQYEGLEIKEVQEGYIIYDFELMTVEEMEENQAQKERERLGNLSLTKADVERAIYTDKGMDFDDLIEYVKAKVPTMDIKALKIELGAKDFYRKHPYINQLGQLLGYTSDDLDFLFENKVLPKKVINESETNNSETVSEQGE